MGSIMNSQLCIFVLLVMGILPINATTSPLNKSRDVQQQSKRSDGSQYDLPLHYLVLMHSLESKVENLEKSRKVMLKEIKALKNLTGFRCESGVEGQYRNPPPPWPYIRNVSFKKSFQEKPTLTYGLYLLDASKSKKVRIRADIGQITNRGFHINLRPWLDTELYSAKVSWMACGK